LTSSFYSSESKIYELAKANDKIFGSNGEEYIYSPILKTRGRILPIEQKVNKI
jgi:hypothetical protein